MIGIGEKGGTGFLMQLRRMCYYGCPPLGSNDLDLPRKQNSMLRFLMFVKYGGSRLSFRHILKVLE